MTIDPAVIPGFLLVIAELIALAAVGFVVVRVALRQTDDHLALAQGLVIGLALWGVIVNLVLHVVPGLAGVVVGWVVTLALGAGLAWHAPASIRPRGRTLAGFAVVALALFWIALAGRQLLTLPDAGTHLGLAASIQAGVAHPPELPWNPGIHAPYHYGFDLLVGLLAPPAGPDLVFVTELLGAYIWMSFALIVVTTLIRRGSWMVALTLAPLLLTAGGWTLVFVSPPHVLHLPVPTGIPSAGLRAALADIYWPVVELPWGWPGLVEESGATPPNIFKPFFVLAYVLAFVVLERAASHMDRRWLRNAALALLVGFLALADEAIAAIVLALWIALEAAAFWTTRHARADQRRAVLHAAAGPALAALLLAAAGGAITGILTGALGSALSVGWTGDLGGSRRLLGAFDPRPGGVGLLGLGPFVVAAAAALLARRDRLVLALSLGAGVFLLAVLMLEYEFSQKDIYRFDGHARNFALLALLVALSSRIHALRPRWRYAAVTLIVVVMIWPTAVGPVRNLGLAVGQGVQVANPQPEPSEFTAPMGRYVVERLASEPVAAYIRDHTAADARVLSPSPGTISLATGRPNAAGFVGHLHLFPHSGPEHLDALRYLEPAALRRLGIAYVHAPDAWVAELPDRAARWLADPGLFDLLIRDGGEALYRVRPEFLRLDAAPTPASFEALRQAVPASTTVYVPAPFPTAVGLRLASALSHARVLGAVYPTQTHIHLLTPFQANPLGEQVPDLVVMPRPFAPWMFPPAARQPIWWNDEVAVYAPRGAVTPIMSPPPPREQPLDMGVRTSDVRAGDGRITFTTTLDDRAPEQWTGQDWVVVAVDRSPWALPLDFQPGGRAPMVAQWFAGQMVPGRGTTTHVYEFDASAPRLAVRDPQGAFTAVASTASELGAGTWMLGIRLQHEWRPNSWREVAFIPVLLVEVSDAGEVSYQVYDDLLAVQPRM